MNKVIGRTKSLCNVCYKVIPAKILLKNNRIFIEKTCEEHGHSEHDHVWDDPFIYNEISSLKTIQSRSSQLALVMTYKCNMNCPTCYVKANQTRVPDFDISDLNKADDFQTIFLTGGEPTVRDDLPDIIKKLKQKGKKVVIFSNGINLENKKYLAKLKKSGLSYVILQFDSLESNKNLYIRGENLLKKKIKAINNFEELKIPFFLYSVVLKKNGILDEASIMKLLHFAFKLKYLKAIGVNPLWRLGRYRPQDFIPSSEIIKTTNKLLKIDTKDWTESTKLLCNFDKIISLFMNRRRVFSKCMLKCIVIVDKEKVIPITKIFNIIKINNKLDQIYTRKNYFLFFLFLNYFIFDQIFLNLFKNKNFRILLKKIFLNLRFLFNRNKLLISPFRLISLAIFPVKENLDLNFLSECNFLAISSRDTKYKPACLQCIQETEQFNN